MAVTWNEANSAIARTSNVIITVRDTLTGLGIDVSNVCDIESISEAVDKMLEHWLEEVNRTVDSISFEMLGNFLVTLAALLAQILAAAAASYVNIFLLEILAGNILNSIVSAIVFALALIPGVELILQYYLVKTLRRDVLRRRELGVILNDSFMALIGLFDSFYSLFKFEDDLLFADLKRALRNIRSAESILGREVSKNFNGEKPVTVNNITAADNYIDKAINALTHQNYDIVYKYIKDINAAYGITADAPQGFDVPGWIKYFETLQPLISLNFFTYTSTPGTQEYENEVQIKNARYIGFIAAMMKIMPPILQRIVLNATFKNSSTVIFERIPVWANNIKLMNDLKGFLDNTLSVPDKFLNDYLNMNRTPPPPEPALFKNPATKDITWRNITSKIRIEEAGILLFPSYWDYIKHAGGLLQSILLPTLNILRGVDGEITEVLSSDERPGIAELSVQQFKWINELTTARGLLSTILNSTTLFEDVKLNPLQVYNSTVQGDLKMQELQNFIKEKSFDVKTQTAKTQPCDIVYETAQRYLGSLVLNMYIIVSPAAAKNTITGLQSMRVAITQQMSLDKKEAAICSNFIAIVESNPLFIAARPYLDKLLHDLEQTPIGSEIANQLLTGDISGIIGILEGYWATKDVVDLIVDCADQHSDNTMDPSILGLGSNVNIEAMQSIEKKVSALRDMQSMITDRIPFIIEAIEEIPQA